MRKVRLLQYQCPGDLVCLTLCIESLHRMYPGQFITAVLTNADELFEFNPLVAKLPTNEPDVKNVMMSYDRINESGIPIHFGEAYCSTLGAALGLPLTLRVERPYLYLSHEEAANSVLEQKTGHAGAYALVNAGYKDDVECKYAGRDLYQSVVDAHRGRVQFVQIGDDRDRAHHHPRLEGVIDLVGKTDLRELLRLVSRAAFAIGPNTFLQHVSAAFSVPYVGVFGGREPVAWNTYPTQIPLGTHGLLPCCRLGACWRSKIIETELTKGAGCFLPVLDARGDTVPACLAMLKDRAIEAVEVLLNGAVEDEGADSVGDVARELRATMSNAEPAVTSLNPSTLMNRAKLAGFGV